MRWTPLSFSSYLILNKSPGVAKIKLHWLICLFTNYFLLQFKKKSHKIQIIKLAQISWFITKKEKRPSLWPPSATPCCGLHSITLIHRILLSVPRNFVGPSLLLSLLWRLHSLVSFFIIFFMVSGRTKDNLRCQPTTLDWNPFPILLQCLLPPHLMSTSASSVRELVKRKILP